jgi:histidinol-phosphatase (PHP family)
VLTDYHTHTWRCGHATGSMSEYVEAAMKRGITEIGLTDHLWLYWLPPDQRPREWAIIESDYDAHYSEMLETRERYRGRINVRVAVEADFVDGHQEQLREILSRYKFDFVLGAVHYMDGWLIDAPENEFRYREQRVAEIYRRYFLNLQKAMRLGLFDVIAHFDLPKKFGFLPEEDLSALADETLDVAAETAVVIEVSTAGLRKPVREIYPAPRLIAELRRRDIPIVLSSDAHAPEEIGADYDQSIALVRQAGYTELAAFEGRQRRMMPLTT